MTDIIEEAQLRLEAARMEDLSTFDIVENEWDDALSFFSESVAFIADCPIAEVILITDSQEYVKSRVGPEVELGAISRSLDRAALTSERNYIVGELAPYVPWQVREPHNDRPIAEIQFYAGFPITSFRGFRLGIVRVLDTRPRILTASRTRLIENSTRALAQTLESARTSNLLLGHIRELRRIIGDTAQQSRTSIEIPLVQPVLRRSA